MLSANRNQKAAARFLKKLSSLPYSVKHPRVIDTDKNPSYPPAFEKCQSRKIFNKDVYLRQVKYLNNILEQDHRFVKKRVKSILSKMVPFPLSNCECGNVMSRDKNAAINIKNFALKKYQAVGMAV